jgi:hypothetical protein
MDAETKKELAGVMGELAAWLRGERSPKDAPRIRPMINLEEFDLKNRLDAISDEEILSRATTLRSEALRAAAELSRRISVTSTGPSNAMAAVVNNVTSYASALADLLRRSTNIETVTIDEQPSRFGLRKGDRAAWRRNDGSPDLENSGVIVDGIWRGQVGGGWYEVSYEIERSDGLRFRAKPLELVKLPVQAG